MTDVARFEAFVREYQDMVFATAVRLLGLDPFATHAALAVAGCGQSAGDDGERVPAAELPAGSPGRAAVREHKRVLQTGSMERSNEKCRFACELVRNGRIGNVTDEKGVIVGDPKDHSSTDLIQLVSGEQ